jgi:dipeptidase E
MTSKLIAIGGGGFLMEPENPLLDLYCLSCTGKTIPKVCFIPTASGDSEEFLTRFYTAFARYPCEPSHLAFFRKPRAGAIPLEDIERNLLSQDLIYVGGGNTRAMLAVWLEWKIDEILKKAWHSGILLAGMSAGAICWFESGGSDSSSTLIDTLSPLLGLGFIHGSCTPHYDGEPHRRPEAQRLIASGELPPGIGIDDGSAVLFEGQKIVEVVASRAGANAYRVKLESGQIIEELLEAKLLT